MARNIFIIRRKPSEATPQALEGLTSERFKRSTYGDINLPPMWAKVLETTGDNHPNHVDVELVNGLKLKHVPVASRRWVTKVDSSNSTGRKDIPPEGSKVLVLFPDGIVENAIIVCSGFEELEDSQTSKLLLDGEETIEREYDEFGWHYSKDKETGEILYESPEVESGLQVIISIDLENGIISIKGKYDGSSSTVNEVLMDSDGIIISDKNDNVYTLSSAGVKIEDTNGNTISMETGKVTINGTALEVSQPPAPPP